MAKKFGKQRKGGKDPRDLFGAPLPPPRSSARPASSTPLADYLAPDWPGVDEDYVVLPRSLAEGMSLPWQQQMSALLAQFHQAHAGLSWPVYRVVPSRYENLVDLDEEQLAEAGYLVEIDADGEMVYRERSGRKVEDPRNTRVLVSVLDPIAPRRGPRRPAPEAQEQPQAPERPKAVPMNIPPAPVWRSTPTRPSSSVPPLPGVERKRVAGAGGVGAAGGAGAAARGEAPRGEVAAPTTPPRDAGAVPPGAGPGSPAAGASDASGSAAPAQPSQASPAPLPLGWELPAPVTREEPRQAEPRQEPATGLPESASPAAAGSPGEHEEPLAEAVQPVAEYGQPSAATYHEPAAEQEPFAAPPEPEHAEQQPVTEPPAEGADQSAATSDAAEEDERPVTATEVEEAHEAPEEAPQQERVMPLGWEEQPPPSPWRLRAARLEPEAEPGTAPDAEATVSADDRTPPRGIPQPAQPGQPQQSTERGWFDELPEDADVQFGPTGQPTELPYRYRP